VSPTNSVGVELSFYVNTFSCSNKFARLLAELEKRIYTHKVVLILWSISIPRQCTPSGQGNITSQIGFLSLIPSITSDSIWDV